MKNYYKNSQYYVIEHEPGKCFVIDTLEHSIIPCDFKPTMFPTLIACSQAEAKEALSKVTNTLSLLI